MKRHVLFVPLEEIRRHLGTNERQDIKVVAPSILMGALYEILKKKGKQLKTEISLEGNIWKRSYKTTANNLCESADFAFETQGEAKGPFAISFANDRAEQEEHYHKHHTEIYFSEHRISGYYRNVNEKRLNQFDLRDGGIVLFQPYVMHYIELGGLTLIIETPSFENDRIAVGDLGKGNVEGRK